MAQAQPLSDKSWVRVGLWALLTGALSLAVSIATAAWKTRDYIDSRDERLLSQIRAERTEQLSRYLTRDDWNQRRYEDTERLNQKLEIILDRIRSTR